MNLSGIIRRMPTDTNARSFANFHSLPSLGDYDLIVVGGGAAGSGAAITAGRLGLRTLLIEQLSFLGGTGVGSQVTPWMGNQIDLGPLNEGLNAEIQTDLEATGDASGYFVNPEAIKFVLEQKAVEAGVTILFEATVVGIHTSGEQMPELDGVVIAPRQGLRRAQAGAFVDASGDANVANLAGVPTAEGRESDRVHQPMSLRFVLGGIDIPAVERFMLANGPQHTVHRVLGLLNNGPGMEFIKKYAEMGKWPQKWLDTFTIQLFEIPGRPQEFWFNCPRITGHDPLDPLSTSKAYIEGRRMIKAYLELFQRHIGGAADRHSRRPAHSGSLHPHQG